MVRKGAISGQSAVTSACQSGSEALGHASSSARGIDQKTAASDVESSLQSGAADFEKSWADATNEYSTPTHDALIDLGEPLVPEYKNPAKKWRVKQKAMPQWYKSRSGVRTRVQSGAARVARFRPKPRSTLS